MLMDSSAISDNHRVTVLQVTSQPSRVNMTCLKPALTSSAKSQTSLTHRFFASAKFGVTRRVTIAHHTAKPDALEKYELWKYGLGAHASAAKRIIGSIEIFVRSQNNAIVSIRHLLIGGSSSWVIGRNITRPYNMLHIGENALQLPRMKGDKIPMIDNKFHSYIAYDRFLSDRLSSPSLSCLSASPHATEKRVLDSWAETRRIVDKVHRHVCGHATFSDMRTLLIRNGLWNESVQHYLATKVSQC